MGCPSRPFTQKTKQALCRLGGAEIADRFGKVRSQSLGTKLRQILDRFGTVSSETRATCPWLLFFFGSFLTARSYGRFDGFGIDALRHSNICRLRAKPLCAYHSNWRARMAGVGRLASSDVPESNWKRKTLKNKNYSVQNITLLG